MHRIADGGHGADLRLLVSVSTAEEARDAIEGGADIIDAKDPRAGALGPVSLETLAAIRLAAGPTRLLTAALGDVQQALGPGAWGLGTARTEIESLACAYASAGAGLVKLGCAVGTVAARDGLAAAVRGAGRAGAGVVAVTYADATGPAAVTLDAVIDLAVAVGARGVLVDTANKTGPGLTSLVRIEQLAAWTARARRSGLLAAVAGSLSVDQLPAVAACGAHVVGVRGAACEGGRLGRITTQRVTTLVARLRTEPSTSTRG